MKSTGKKKEKDGWRKTGGDRYKEPEKEKEKVKEE